jgi:UDP-N-acetylglucosamine:LPS N-acetylglucosamine transferase
VLTGPLLVRTVAGILGDPERLRAMGKASLSLRKIDAAEVIVRECYALMGGHHDAHRSVGAAGG